MNPSGIDAYTLGRTFSVMPIPMNPAQCVEVCAGPVTFVVEGRHLTDQAINDNAIRRGRPDEVFTSGIDEVGGCVHVIGTADRLEHLRFDCFDNEPHYHYLDNESRTNTVVRLDQFAEGDPREWTLNRLRTRLPHMFEHLGLTALADQIRDTDLTRAISEVEVLLTRAGHN